MKCVMLIVCVLIAVIGLTIVTARYAFQVLVLAAAGGYCVLSRSNPHILCIGKLRWTQRELCRHFLITGDTGSGKTTSGFHPLLLQLTQNVPDWGGLVLGVKGDESEFIHELLESHDRTHDQIDIKLRPNDASTKWQPPHRYNLLSDRSIPWKLVELMAIARRPVG